MTFTAISSGSIEVGDPITAELMGLIRTNFDDHETRIGDLEGGASKVIIINDLVVGSAQLASAGTLTGLAHIRVPSSASLNTAIISTTAAGSSGTTQIDLLKSTTINGTYTSVFSTKPSITSAASPGVSSNAVFSTTAVSAGDYLRVDITSLQVGQKPFVLTIFGDIS